VRKHWLTHDVADCVDRRLGRAAPCVDFDETALVDFGLRLVQPGIDSGRRPTDTSTLSKICSRRARF
jgi:hypothetical protein